MPIPVFVALRDPSTPRRPNQDMQHSNSDAEVPHWSIHASPMRRGQSTTAPRSPMTSPDCGWACSWKASARQPPWSTSWLGRPHGDSLKSAAGSAKLALPRHRHALHVFGVIFTDGATYRMLDGNGYGLGVDGLYDPELMLYFARRRSAKADQLATIVKATAVGGHYSLQTSGGSSYAKARNLLPHVRAAYDHALDQCDVLVMPTVPGTASPLPSGAEDNITLLAQALGMVGNTAPLNATGTPRSRCRLGSSTACRSE
jgi:hypothetical protein